MDEAARTVQRYWRGYKARKDYKTMMKGFILLQKLFLRKMSSKESDKWKIIFLDSEIGFKKYHEGLVKRRKIYEKQYNYLSGLSPKKYKEHISAKRVQAALQIQEFWKQIKLRKTNEEFENRKQVEKAAIIIQNYTRKWLMRRRKKSRWSKPLLQPQILSEERVKKLQEEIDYYQRTIGNDPKINLTKDSFQDCERRYSKFQKSLHQSRIAEHRISVLIAKTKAICESISNPISLDEYDPQLHWRNYHSLSLPFATVSRIEHKAALKKAAAPKWRILLEDYE